jgi:integrase
MGKKSTADTLLRAIRADGKQSVELDPRALEALRLHLESHTKDRPVAARRVWDSKTPGLFLRVMPSGALSFYVQWSRKGAKSLGKFPGLTLEGARQQTKIAQASASTAPDRIPDIARAKPASESLTLEQFVEKHYRLHAKRHLDHGDADAGRILRVLPKLVKKPLADITTKAIQAELDGRDVEPATMARDRNVIRAALNLAIDWGILEKNPAVGLKVGKAKEGVTRYLSVDEEAALVAALEARDQGMREARARTIAGKRSRDAALAQIAADTYPDHITPLVLVALHTGCRRGELLKLRWADVRLGGTPQLTIRGGTAKSGKTRHIPLNATATAALTQWRAQNPDAVRVFGLVDVKKAWAGVLKASKIAAFRFHDLRHTFASKLVQRGVPLNTVRELLGHADIKMTLRYAHLAPENKAAAVALLDMPSAATNVTPIRRKA